MKYRDFDTDKNQEEKLEKFYEILAEYNKKVNLTAISGREDFIINGWLTQCSEDTFNDLCYIYNATDGQNKWQAWKDTCTTMFCIGMIYANHRIKGNLSF